MAGVLVDPLHTTTTHTETKTMPAYDSNQTDRDRVIRNIEAVLKRVNPKANATEAEVDQALAYAQAQMRKYDIEMAEVAAAGDDLPKLDDIEERVVREHSKQDRHELSILGAVCTITGCSCYTKTVYREHPKKPGRTQKKKQMVVYGYKSDVAVAHAMFSELIFLVRAFARANVEGKWHMAHYWYCNGFGAGLYTKARELKREQEKKDNTPATANTNMNALVVCKNALVTQYEKTLRLRPAPRSRVSVDAVTSEAYAAGTKDGREYEHRDKLGAGAKEVKAIR